MIYNDIPKFFSRNLQKVLDNHHKMWYNIIKKTKGGEIMGMTDKQFNAFLRRLIRGIKDILSAKTIEEKNEKTKELLEELQKDLED